MSWLLYIRTYSMIAAAIACAKLADHPLAVFAAVIFIGARQHSLYVLNHDASHGLLFKGTAANKWVATILSNIPFFHHPEAWSFTQWRRVHRLHHAHLFTASDPNYVERQLQGEASSPISRSRLVAELLKAPLVALRGFLIARQDHVEADGRTFRKRDVNHLVTLVRRHPNDPEMRRERVVMLVGFGAVLGAVAALGAWRDFLVFWCLPLYTTYPMILRLMDLTEHRWSDKSGKVTGNTVSTKANFIEHWLISDLNRGLHREHHLDATVPCYRLSKFSRKLQAEGVLDRPRSSFFAQS